jgi:hypothetical protein
MKNILALSLVLYGNDYIDRFFKFTFKTIIKNINNLNKIKKFNIKFIISTDNDSLKKIKDNIETQINADIRFLLINNIKDKYYSVTKEQLCHLKITQDENIEYLIFLYADIIFSQDSFKNSIKYLVKNKKTKAICTFALLLNEKNKKFKKFFYCLLRKKEDHLKLLVSNKNMIDKYHQSFEENKLNFNRSFFYLISNKNLFIKTFHYHPLIIRPNKKIRLENIEKQVYTLDNKFISKYFLFNEIYVEENLKKVSSFSFDYKSRFKFNKYENKISKNLLREFNSLFFALSAHEKTEIENQLFLSNTINYTNDTSKNNFFSNKLQHTEIHNKYINIMKKNTNSIALFSAINALIKNIKPNYIVILFYFLLLIVKFIIFKKYIIKVFEILYKKKIIMLNMKELNLICAILYATYIKTILKKYFIIK